MGFIGVYRAVYDYEPRDSGELTVAEGDLLYILEKNNDDGWWKAKKKAGDEDDDEPTGLVPHNYVEEVCHFELAPLLIAHRVPLDTVLRTMPIIAGEQETKGKAAIIWIY